MSTTALDDYLEQIEAEHGLISTASEWITEGWGVPAQSITPPMIAVALFNEAKTQEAVVAEESKRNRIETDPAYPALLRRIAFGILTLDGHAPMAIVEVSGGVAQATYSDHGVDVVIVDWDCDGLTNNDVESDPCLFVLPGKLPFPTIGRSYVAEMIDLSSMPTDTAFGLLNAVCNRGEETLQNEDELKGVRQPLGLA